MSALVQSYQNVEIIVADDGSTDDTKRVIEAYDGRVRHLYHANAGPAAARNLGLRHASGEFIAFLDSDDEWLPWKLELQVAVLRRFPDVGMVWTDFMSIDGTGRVLATKHLQAMYDAYRHVALPSAMELCGQVSDLELSHEDAPESGDLRIGDVFPLMLFGNLVHTSTVLMRRDRVAKIGGFKEGLWGCGEDYDFFVGACFAGPVAFADVSSMRYQVDATDQLTAPANALRFARNYMTTLLHWLVRGEDRIRSFSASDLRRLLARAHAWLGEEEFGAGNRLLARKHLWIGVRFGRRGPRVLLCLGLSLCPPALADWMLSLYRATRRMRAGPDRALRPSARPSR